MKLTAAREDFLTPLQSVIGVVERRQTMPILANVLLSVREDGLSMTGSDLEVELVASRQVSSQQAGDVTIPGRKLLDIFRALPEKTAVTLSAEGDRVNIRAGRSRFALSSLPASEFPVVDDINAQQTLTISQSDLRKLIDKTHFAMAQQDVRYYLNGLLLETDGKILPNRAQAIPSANPCGSKSTETRRLAILLKWQLKMDLSKAPTLIVLSKQFIRPKFWRI